MRFLIPLLATVLVSFTAAMIEAPIRLYVTENLDGTATPSYKTPTTVYAPISLRVAHLLLQSLLNSIKFFNASQKLQAPKTQSSL